jgi:hypothetical protein
MKTRTILRPLAQGFTRGAGTAQPEDVFLPPPLAALPDP